MKGLFSEEIQKFINLSDEKKTYDSVERFKKHIQLNRQGLEKKYPLAIDSLLKELPVIPRVRCLYFINPHNPLGIIQDQDYVNSIAKVAAKYNLAIIEDLAHMELMHNPESAKKMGFFNKTNIPLEVITLLSPSKSLGMAECRVGFALVNNSELVHSYKEHVFNDGLFLPHKQMNALEKAFILNPEREAYLSSNADEYRFRKNLIKYMIYGNDKSELDKNDKEKVIAFFNSNKLDINLFENGIKNVSLLNKDIESGFFGVLDLSFLKNKYFINTQIKDNRDLGFLLNIYNIISLTGDNIYYPRRLVIRLPFCINPLLLVETFRRINIISQNVSPRPLLIEEEKVGVKAELSPGLVSYAKQASFSEVQSACQELYNHIKLNYDSIINILTDYESYTVAVDEVQRAMDCLHTANINESYYNHACLNQGTSFLPLNLPLYSLILFGVMPSFQTNKIYLKPPQTSAEIYKKVYDSLKIDHFFKNIELKCIDRELFLENYVYLSDVILFTGKYENALKVIKKSKKESFFIFNGAGHNPLVITNNADLHLAVKKTVDVKTYNNGQDCAGPDTILVQNEIFPAFMATLTKELSSVPIGNYKDHKNVVGKLTESQHITKLADFLAKNSANIVYGGTMDFRNAIVHPTIIVTNINDATNYEELFAPILYITTYDTDAELDIYFGNSNYEKNAMYISLFGNSKYVESLEKSIILKNQIIHDIEKGNEEFGGYGACASFVSFNGERICKPILVPREISEKILLASVKMPVLSFHNQVKETKEIKSENSSLNMIPLKKHAVDRGLRNENKFFEAASAKKMEEMTRDEIKSSYVERKSRSYSCCQRGCYT